MQNKEKEILRFIREIVPSSVPTNLSKYDLLKSLRDASKGTLEVNGELFAITDVYIYSTKKESWFELQLKSLVDLRILYLEFYEDDELEISLSNGKFKIHELDKSADEIEEISDNEEGYVIHNNKKYFYEDDYKLKFSKRDSNPEKFYVYEFESSDGEFLTVEEWGNDEDGYTYEVYLSVDVPDSAINVVSIS